jgi:hypothetical protein
LAFVPNRNALKPVAKVGFYKDIAVGSKLKEDQSIAEVVVNDAVKGLEEVYQ